MCPPTSTTMMKRRANKDSIIYDEPIITFTFQVPTKGCESPRQQGNHRRVDIDNLKTKDDLDNLKKNDPFLFLFHSGCQRGNFGRRKSRYFHAQDVVDSKKFLLVPCKNGDCC
mmetsp:Transcript_31956/g.62656  ORF Transcript_31956/g.62656 Transcript_31956/m.62656 type:complete len:113 (+) Transcript_31956:178-516(+)